MLVDEDPSDNTPLPERTVFGSSFPGRSIAAGKIFTDSDLPDLVFAMATGELIFFANQGVDENGEFNGFRGKGKLRAVKDDCHIRDVKIVSFAPCTQSIVTAITCGYDIEGSDNVVFTTPVPCDDVEAATNTTARPTPSVSPLTVRPSDMPSSSPSALPTTDAPTEIPDPPHIVNGTCRTGLASLDVDVLTDLFPEDTSWDLWNDLTGDSVGSRQSYDAQSTLYSNRLCLYQNSVYTFSIYDENGDSICCQNGDGYFALTLDGIEMYRGGEGFGSQYDYTFVVPTGYCDFGESLFELTLKTDLFEMDTSWILVNDQSSTTVASGGSYAEPNTLYVEPFCLEQNQAYTFTLFDAGNDSLCCQYGNGYYSAAIDGNEIFQGGEGFGSQITQNFFVEPSRV